MVRIFEEYVAGRGIFAIAEGLTRDGIPSPSAHDPARNRHRASSGGAWGKSAVRAILANPRYTGRQVWGRQRRDEVLIDVEDVALGHATKLRWADRDSWIWSAQQTHEPLVTPELFAEAQRQQAATGHRGAIVKPRTARGPYVLSSLVSCGLCGRRMQGAWSHGRAYYRCKFPTEYAIATSQHPKTVYVREASVVPALDRWLATVFDPDHLDATCEALAAASEPDEGAVARREAARRKIADCDHRLGRYRAALEAGADPIVVAGWMTEVRGERLVAERELGTAVPAEKMTRAEVKALVAGLRDVVTALAQAAPADKAAIYSELGIRLIYNPETGRVLVEARPCTQERVGEGT